MMDETPERPADKTAQQVHDEVVAWLTAAAQAQTKAVLGAQDELLGGFLKAHEVDLASFFSNAGDGAISWP